MNERMQSEPGSMIVHKALQKTQLFLITENPLPVEQTRWYLMGDSRRSVCYPVIFVTCFAI